MPEPALQAQVEGGAAEGRQEAEILSGLQTEVRSVKAQIQIGPVQIYANEKCFQPVVLGRH